MKKALILYWHGLGDIIMLTPHLRHLFERGYKTDLMCRAFVKKSKLLDICPYVDKLITVENPWKSKIGFSGEAAASFKKFNMLKNSYDWSGASPHHVNKYRAYHKIDMTSMELGLEIKDKRLEVFIPETAEKEAKDYIDGDYIFVHTMPGPHLYHAWDASGWIKKNLPAMKIIDTGYNCKDYMLSDNINTSFAIMREAKYRVLSSSVFVFACDAMGIVMDAVNYGRVDRKCLNVLNKSNIRHLKEVDKWIK